jgi:RsiW-degrading membrane proteinase PrsW (M82 family)
LHFAKGKEMPSGGDKKSRERPLPSMSEIVPPVDLFEKREWIKKGALVPFSLTLLAVVLMELAVEHEPPWYEFYALIVAGYLAVETVHIIYKLCGIRKPFFWLAFVGCSAFALGAVMETHCSLLQRLDSLSGWIISHDALKSASFFDRWAAHFFSGALPFEAIKLAPVLIAFGIGRALSSPWRERLGIWEPLDGVLLGATAGVGFNVAQSIYGLAFHLNCSLDSATYATYSLKSPNSLLLLLPRSLGEMAGHAAYTGFLGYAIGLAIVRPRRRWLTLLVGLLISTLAHSLSMATTEFDSYKIFALIESIVFYCLLAAAILKARQISPSRAYNFATSLIDDSVAARLAGADLQIASAQAAGTRQESSLTAQPGPAQGTARPVFTLYVSGNVITLEEGRKLAPGEISGLTAASGGDSVAQVVCSPKHPGDVGLRNDSGTTWKARLPWGLEGEIPPGKAIRLARGMIFFFGDVRGEIL